MTLPPVLEVEDLTVTFRIPRGLGRAEQLQAVRKVSFSVAQGEVLGIVGESGSGKSTMARAIVKLDRVAGGRIRLEGDEITDLSEREFRSRRRKVQMVFQDPYSSLDPAMTVGQSIAEPLKQVGGLSGNELDDRVNDLLTLVELAPHHRHRYPHEFSGGQRQRVAIARALALEPALLICDEAVSALDVSTQNQVINLLVDLRKRLGMAYLFVSHDLAVVRNVADRVLVMYLGKVVEQGPTEDVLRAPKHPYTQALLAAMPRPDPDHQPNRKEHILKGELPDPMKPPKGCAFQSRCPLVTEVCCNITPELKPRVGSGAVACHMAGHEAALTPGSASDMEYEIGQNIPQKSQRGDS